MILDLKGEPHMDHLVGMLYSAVNENDSRLISIVSDMSQQESDYKGPKHQQLNGEYGIWQTIIDIIKLIFISFANGMKRNRNLAVKALLGGARINSLQMSIFTDCQSIKMVRQKIAITFATYLNPAGAVVFSIIKKRPLSPLLQRN